MRTRDTMIIGYAGALALGLLLGARPAAAAVPDKFSGYDCTSDQIKNGWNTMSSGVVNACHPEYDCPATVHNDDQEKTAADLSVEGFWAMTFNPSQKGIYTSDFKAYQPVLVPGTTDDGVENIDISPDGNWIAYFASGKGITLVKRDGSGKVTKNIPEIKGMYWYRNSPKGNEIAYAAVTGSNTDVMAVPVTLSATAATFGDPRKIGSALGGFSGELAVGGHSIFMRGPANGGQTNGGMLYIIPDNGNGMATAANKYNSYWAYNCGMGISPDGKYLLGNKAGNTKSLTQFSDCVPDQHITLTIVPTKDDTSKVLPVEDWWIGQALSVDWCPKAWRDMTRPAYDAITDIHDHNWTNSMDYIVTADQKGTKGGYLVNWKTHIWYAIAKDGLGANAIKNPAAWIKGVPVSLRSTDRQPSMSREPANGAWRDAMGRQLPGQSLERNPASVPSYLCPDGKR